MNSDESVVAHCNVGHYCTEYVDNALHKQFDDLNLKYAINVQSKHNLISGASHIYKLIIIYI